MAFLNSWSALLKSLRAMNCAPNWVCTCAASRIRSCFVSCGSFLRLLSGVSYLMILLLEQALPASASATSTITAETLRSITELLLRGGFDPALEFRVPARAVQHLALQLPARGVDVIAARAADHRLHVRIQQDLLERADGGFVRTRI